MQKLLQMPIECKIAEETYMFFCKRILKLIFGYKYYDILGVLRKKSALEGIEL